MARLSYYYNTQLYSYAPTFHKYYTYMYGGEDFCFFSYDYKGRDRTVIVYKTCEKCYRVIATATTVTGYGILVYKTFRTIYESALFLEEIAKKHHAT